VSLAKYETNERTRVWRVRVPRSKFDFNERKEATR